MRWAAAGRPRRRGGRRRGRGCGWRAPAPCCSGRASSTSRPTGSCGRPACSPGGPAASPSRTACNSGRRRLLRRTAARGRQRALWRFSPKVNCLLLGFRNICESGLPFFLWLRISKLSSSCHSLLNTHFYFLIGGKRFYSQLVPRNRSITSNCSVSSFCCSVLDMLFLCKSLGLFPVQFNSVLVLSSHLPICHVFS